MYATRKIHEEWSRQRREEHRRRIANEDPADRDYRIWRQIRDMDQRLDPGSWPPFSNDYPGPELDPSGNIIPRHTGYSGCSSESSFDRARDPWIYGPADLNNEDEAEAAEAPLPEASYDGDD